MSGLRISARNWTGDGLAEVSTSQLRLQRPLRRTSRSHGLEELCFRVQTARSFYEATRYAKSLGVELEKDVDLVWVAREASSRDLTECI